MNHLGDTNKMVDTPRTDAAKKIVLGGVGGDWEVVHIAFSRQLERELNASNDRIKRLEEENNELRAEEARLLNTNGELERRIKRLEEAGDAMEQWTSEYGPIYRWRKAKEDKL